MAKKQRPYRILIHNSPAEEDIVLQQIAQELGNNITVVEWHEEKRIDYVGLVHGGGEMPQREIVIALTYTENDEASDLPPPTADLR
jgi:hypothetical protein